MQYGWLTEPRATVTMEGQNVAPAFGYPSAAAAGGSKPRSSTSLVLPRPPEAGTRRFTKTLADRRPVATRFVDYVAPAAADQAPTITVTPAPPAKLASGEQSRVDPEEAPRAPSSSR